MRIDVFTVLPALVEDFLSHSLIGSAKRNGLLNISVRDIRDATDDPHRSVDDAPFGGGPGMVLKPEPVFAAVESANPPRPLILLDPAGKPFSQDWAKTLAGGHGFSLLCGRYEGVDERIRTCLVDEELSLGDYVLSGGEVAALAVIEAVGRLVPGVMGNAKSADSESFEDDLLDYPQYTRPAIFQDMEVPEVLRSGDHPKISRWRKVAALLRTMERRPDLIEQRGGLTEAEQQLLEEFEI